MKRFSHPLNLLLLFALLLQSSAAAAAPRLQSGANAGWEEVGPGSASNRGISYTDWDSTYPAIVAGSDGLPYVAWCENIGGNSEIYVLHWNGGAWEEVGTGSASGGGITNNAGASCFPSVAVAPDGAPWIAWQDRSLGNYEIYVLRWDGSAWQQIELHSAELGGISNTAGDSTYPEIAIGSDGLPAVIWQDVTSGNAEIYARRWNGSAWVEMGADISGGVSANPGASMVPALTAGTSGSFYAAWQDLSGGNYEIYARSWNGTAWIEVGAGSASGGGISSNNGASSMPTIAVGGDGRPLVVWQDNESGHDEIYARRWSGSAWLEIGGGSASGGGISNTAGLSRYPSVAVGSDGIPWIAWSDNSSGNYEAYVRRWNNSLWEEASSGSAGGGGISSTILDSLVPALTVAGGALFAVWRDGGGTYPGEIFVRRYHPGDDEIAPAAVTSLTASTGSASGTVNLTWTAPGDDGSIGTASSYIVRYAVSAITSEAQWNAATDVSGEPAPLAGGAAQSMTVSGLTPGQRYSFAIKTQDEIPNLSPLSNSPSAVAGSGPASCIRVTVVADEPKTYLPLIARPAGALSAPAAPADPEAIRSLSENTGGCMKFVGETIHFRLDAGERGGAATISIGDVHTGIPLYDDGTHGDAQANNGVYERDYVTTAIDAARTVRVYGRFRSFTGAVSTASTPGRVTIVDWSLGNSSVAPTSERVIDTEAGIEYAANRLMIVFDESASQQQIIDLLIAKNLLLASWIPGLNIVEIELEEGQSEAGIATDLQAEAIVDAVHRNILMHLADSPLPIPDELIVSHQSEHHNLIRAGAARDLLIDGNEVKVAVLDSGANIVHPDLKNQISGTLIDVVDHENHGTMVAGIIAAEAGNGGMTGIAPGADLYIYKVLNAYDLMLSLTVAQVDNAIAHKVHVINMSWGVTPLIFWTPLNRPIGLRRAIEDAYEANIVLVAAAGNDGKEVVKDDSIPLWSKIEYPAGFTKVLIVGNSNVYDQRAWNSNYGAEVIYAPGEVVLATTSDGGYGVDSGTSFSAPQISALAALILDADANLSNQEVMDIITNTADHVASQLRRINVRRALHYTLTGTLLLEDSLPPRPRNLQANFTGSTIELHWIEPENIPDDFNGFNLYRAEMNPGDVWPDYPRNMVRLAKGLPSSQISFSDTQGEIGKRYQYFLFSVDQADQESIYPSRAVVSLSGWKEVGHGSASAGGISRRSQADTDPVMAVAPDGKLYLAWEATTIGGSTIYLKRWNGSAWEEFPAGSASGGGIGRTSWSWSPSLAVRSNGTLYIAYTGQLSLTDENSDEIIVSRPLNGRWSQLGAVVSGGAACESNIDPSLVAAPGTTSGSDTLYVAWFCVTTPKNVWTRLGYVYLKKWNGSAWVEAFHGSASGTGVGATQLLWSGMAAAPDGKLYFAVSPAGGSIRVKQLNGQKLSVVGPAIPYYGASLAVDSHGIPHLALVDDLEIAVKRFLNGAWVSLDPADPSGAVPQTAGQSWGTALAIPPGANPKPHLLWAGNLSGNDEIYAAFWDLTFWEERGSGAASGGGISRTTTPSQSPVLVYSPNGALYAAWVEWLTDANPEIYVLRWIQ